MHDNSANAAPILATGRSRRSGLGGWKHVDQAALYACARLLGPSITGRLDLTLPSGASAVLGDAGSDAVADLSMRSYRAFWRALRQGPIGFADAYIAGEIGSDDLAALFRFFLCNRSKLHRAGRGRFQVHAEDRSFHRQRANTRVGSRANIAAHYDLGNAFYGAWLDPSLTYSSALYTSSDQTLAEAQEAKNEAILAALDLAAGQRVLEIGCGWGAFACRAAERGAQVTGLTLSREQQSAALDVARSRGLDGRIDVRLEDYRDVDGEFDRIVSIEMIEAVGEENWPHYFATLRDRLAPDGIIVLQSITIDETLFDRYRGSIDFIQRYIFPGGMLPTQSLIVEHANAAGLQVETMRTFGASYARTLAAWREQFQTNWPSICALGFDDPFQRLWNYYLAYCQAGFECGTVDVGIYRLRPMPTSRTSPGGVTASTQAGGD